MPLAIISDLHANLSATEACLKHIDDLGITDIICLGDLVGYGPSPNEVVDLIRERKIKTVLGNHDFGALGMLGLDFFRDPNRSVLRWTSQVLTEENRVYLKNSPMTIESGKTWIAAHASPVNPTRWRYLDSALDVRRLLADIEHNVVFVGHTHKPALVPGQLGVFGFKEGFSYVINPGSVGQSRDGDKRASFCVVDFENYTYQNYRLEYDYSDTYNRFDAVDAKLGSKERKRLLHY